MNRYDEAFNATYKTLEADEFKGWDPYDGLTTPISFLHKHYWSRLLFFYLHKFSPINLRPIFGIKKRSFTQPYSLLGMAHLNRCEHKKAEYFLNIILEDSIKKDNGLNCWDGLDMPIQMRNSYKKQGSDNVISTELAGRFILQYIVKTEERKDELIEVLESTENYFLERMLVEFDGRRHFKYYDATPDEIFVFNSNANLCAFLAEIDSYRGTTRNKKIVQEVIQSILKYQKEDGFWNYNINLKTGVQKKQIDFHQGFILDSLLRVIEAYGSEQGVESSYKKGLEFYRNHQFHQDGRSYYRLPKKWPVNIHNQSQGIITFTKAYKAGYGGHFLDSARKIADWTIENMQGDNGHFFYLKYPFFTNKIPYLRWSDSNMLLALSTLIAVENE